MPHHHDDEQQDTEFYDIATLLASEPESMANPPIPLHDPNRPPPGYTRGARPGGPKWKARMTAWAVTCAMTEADLGEKETKVLNGIINWVCVNGCDVMTMHMDGIAEMCGLPRSTTRDAVTKLVRDEWLAWVERGLRGNPRINGGRSGRAGILRLLNPPSRKKVHESELSGRAKPDQIPSSHASESPPSKESKIPIEPSTRLVGVLSGVAETMEIGSRETMEIWLLKRLAAGPEMASVVIADGLAAGSSRATLYRAAKQVGIIKETLPSLGGGYGKPPHRAIQWRLPENLSGKPETMEI